MVGKCTVNKLRGFFTIKTVYECTILRIFNVINEMHTSYLFQNMY